MKSALLFESGISTQNLFQLFHWPCDQVWSCLGLWLESFQALHLLIQPLTAWSLKIKPMKLFVFPIRKFGVPQVPTESLPYAAQALGKRHISGDLGRCQRKTCWSTSLCYWLIEIQMRVPKWSINFMILYVYIYIYICIYRLLCQAIAPKFLLLNCDIRNATHFLKVRRHPTRPCEATKSYHSYLFHGKSRTEKESFSSVRRHLSSPTYRQP